MADKFPQAINKVYDGTADLEPESMTTEHLLDTRGLSCPLPVLKLRKTMRTVPEGATVVMLATDRGAEQDVMDYCTATGNSFVSCLEDAGGVLRITVKRQF